MELGFLAHPKEGEKIIFQGEEDNQYHIGVYKNGLYHFNKNNSVKKVWRWIYLDELHWNTTSDKNNEEEYIEPLEEIVFQTQNGNFFIGFIDQEYKVFIGSHWYDEDTVLSKEPILKWAYLKQIDDLLEINGLYCKIIDKWKKNDEEYYIGKHTDADHDIWYHALVVDEYKNEEFHYLVDDKIPTHDEVEKLHRYYNPI